MYVVLQCVLKATGGPEFTIHRELRAATALEMVEPYNAKGDADDSQDAQHLKEPLRRCPVRGGACRTVRRMLAERRDRSG